MESAVVKHAIVDKPKKFV